MANHIAYFVSPHGFGHAARATAVIEALQERVPELTCTVYTTTPAWFFADVLDGGDWFCYRSLSCDVGFAQHSSMACDLPGTVRKLSRLYPFGEELLETLAEELRGQGTTAVLCDIAPLGIAVAQQADVPSVLVENFSWEWLYRGYLAAAPELAPFIDGFAALDGTVDHHLKTCPYCEAPADGDGVTVISRPVARALPSCSRDTLRSSLRERLQIADDERAVLLTMGGIRDPFDYLQRLAADLPDKVVLVVPGGDDSGFRRQGNLLLFPYRSDFHHPSLVAASDAVIGKVGYSTVAEVWQGGVPYGFVPRPDFPESPPLVEFIEREIPSRAIAPTDFVAGDFAEEIRGLLQLEPVREQRQSGAAEIADYMVKRVLARVHS